ncbi:MAG: alpha/beta hydrolase, partial [Pseudomonadota bacterium]
MTEAAAEAPSRALLMMEMRALPELWRFAVSWPTLAAISPRGDGQPVLVLPGLITTDRSTVALRTLLSTLGYKTSGWELGRNYGP